MKKNYYAHLTLRSDNAKTGPIPTSITESSTCPTTCAFKGAGCYAENFPLSKHWRHVTEGDRGMGWDMFCDAVSTLPPMQLWRHNVAGDLPGDGRNIDKQALGLLLDANVGKRGFTYSHYRGEANYNVIAMANLRGLTVNLSANSVAEADELADLQAGPVVCVLPANTKQNVKTPKGRTVVVCPATVRDDVSCATCGLCARQRDTIVGFPAHGARTKTIELRLQRTASH